MFIPGSALNANLDRLGTDLSITSDGNQLVHIDTTNRRVGVRTSIPQAEMHIVGNLIANNSTITGTLSANEVDGSAVYDNGIRVLTRQDDIVASGDVYGSGTYDNLSLHLDASGVSPAYYGSTTRVPRLNIGSDGRITSAVEVVLTQVGNLSVSNTTITSPSGVISLGGATLANVGNAVAVTDGVNRGFVQNLIASSIGHANAIEQGTSNVVVVDNGTTRVIQTNIGNVLMAKTTATGTTFSGTTVLGNISIAADTITTTQANGNLTIAANGTGLVDVAGTSALGIPAGDTASRPTDVTAGYIRFNTEANQIEFYNGVAWVLIQNTITDQLITPDGTTNTFILTNSNTTTVGALVSINGTIQIPGVSYVISGDLIVFAETPLVTDLVSVRIIGASTNVSQLKSPSGNNSLIVTDVGVNVTGSTISNVPAITIFSAGIETQIASYSSSSYRTAKYILQASTSTASESCEVLVTHDGVNTAYHTTYGLVNTDGNVLPILGSIASSYSSGNVLLKYTSVHNNTTIKLSTLYITN